MQTNSNYSIGTKSLQNIDPQFSNKVGKSLHMAIRLFHHKIVHYYSQNLWHMFCLLKDLNIYRSDTSHFCRLNYAGNRVLDSNFEF
jgi:hypothetical protein